MVNHRRFVTPLHRRLSPSFMKVFLKLAVINFITTGLAFDPWWKPR